MIALSALLAAAAPLHVATYAYPAYDRTQALAPLAQLVERVTGQAADITLYPSPEALAAAVREGHVDVAVTNLAAFIEASRTRAVRAIAVPDVPAATLDRYRGVLLARRETGARTPADLRDRVTTLRYAEVLPGSTSGALVQAAALRHAGIDRAAFRSIEQAGTHDAALARLLTGESDVAALAETPWRTLRAEKADQAARVVELWRSEPLPPGPVLCVRSPRISCNRVAAALVRYNAESRDVAIALSKGWSETAGTTRFLPVNQRTYAPFISPPR
ncbi:phosphate/phosphite/phosphonate ABC transporter substrate-binding protein [uncultured Sphingomonas sp.]|uniref:phosphate/phosphite/phosphonate ABC transporter substrate-binding protein n=1 Tax=uncultured Sphingomonas sp. TaxID=158754 RepID=UPI00260ECB72|nr:phosphate/phosphite/phosphonate ABC transporter substrate-binding protein [uncultured Sphingomonas sp.]